MGATSGDHWCLVTHPTPSLGSSGFIGAVGRERLGEVAGGARVLEVFVQGLLLRRQFPFRESFLCLRGAGRSPLCR